MSPEGAGLTPDREPGEPADPRPGRHRHGPSEGEAFEVGNQRPGVDSRPPGDPGPRGPGHAPSPTAGQGSSLGHETRDRIRDLLIRMPGTNKNQIARRLGIYPSLRDYHLRRLLREGLVVTRPSDRGRETLCFWWEDAHLWQDPRTRILYGRQAPRRVALYIADHPGATTAEIAGALQRSPGTIRYHLGNLGASALVGQERDGRQVHYRPSDRLTSWVEEIGQGFPRPWQA